jgi:hypothetical protein
MSVIETRISLINRLENGIIRVEMKEGVEVDLAGLKENYEAYQQLIGKDGDALFLIIFNTDTKGNSAVWSKLAEAERSALKRAEAVVIKNLDQDIEASQFKKLYEQGHPIKIFEEEKDALKWLEGLEIFETGISYIQRLQKDVIKVFVKENAVINERGLLDNLGVYKKLIPNGGYFISMFKASNTAEASAKIPFQADERVKLKKAEAFVISSLANRIELEYYISKTKQLYPTRVFETQAEAVEWIDAIRATTS